MLTKGCGNIAQNMTLLQKRILHGATAVVPAVRTGAAYCSPTMSDALGKAREPVAALCIVTLIFSRMMTRGGPKS